MHKLTSNSRKVLEGIPEADRADEVRNPNLNRETDLTERALGVQCSIEHARSSLPLPSKNDP